MFFKLRQKEKGFDASSQSLFSKNYLFLTFNSLNVLRQIADYELVKFD